MLTINLQNPAAVSAFVMSADFACRAAANAATAKWRLDHPDRVKANSVAYFSTNGEKIRVAQRKRKSIGDLDSIVREKRLQYFRDRYVEDKALMNAQAHAYFVAHREQILDSSKQRYVERRDEILGKSRLRYRELRGEINAKRKTPEARAKINARCRKEYEENPEKRIAFEMKYRARELAAPGICTAEQLKARFEFYGNCCAYCGGPAQAADHVKALKRGGSNWPANIRPACTTCNSSKGSKKLSEWKPTAVAA